MIYPCGMSMSKSVALASSELHDTLEAELHEFAAARGVTYDKLCAELRECYDGYHFTHNSIGMYNPFSLLNAFKHREFRQLLV